MTRTLKRAAPTAAVLAAFAMAGCAAPPRAPMAGTAAADGVRQCFWTHQVNGFSAVTDRLVNIRVGVDDYYQLELLGPCPDIDWAQQIALQSRGGSTICTGLDATIIAPGPLGPQRCPVQSVRKLSDAEVAALPLQQRP